MQKRGISQVITTVLIVLLVLAAIIVVWNAVKSVVERGSEGMGAEHFAVSVSYLDSDLSRNPIKVGVRRKAGKGDLDTVKIIFRNSQGQGWMYSNDTDLPDELETMEYIVPRDQIVAAIGEPVEVEVYPVILTSSGREVIGVKGSLERNGCTANCLGRNCGDDSCGGSCGTCAPGLTCVSGVCSTSLMSHPAGNFQTISQPGVYTLGEDVVCNSSSPSGGCIEITADDVTLDCNGHSITPTNPPAGTQFGGISTPLPPNIPDFPVIRNCVIDGSSHVGMGSDYGISIIGSKSPKIINNNITGFAKNIYLTGLADGGLVQNNQLFQTRIIGLDIYDVDGLVITNNKFSGFQIDNSAAILLAVSENVNFTNNLLTAPPRTNYTGFQIGGNNAYNLVSGNTVVNALMGITMSTGPFQVTANNTVKGNTISSPVTGIKLSALSLPVPGFYSEVSNNLIDSNTITDPAGNGILLRETSVDNDFKDNRVCGSGLVDFNCTLVAAGATNIDSGGNIFDTEADCSWLSASASC